MRKPINRNSLYSLAGWVRTENAGNTTIEASFWTDRSGGNAISQPAINVPLTGTNDWTYVSGDLSIPEQTNFFNVRLSLYPPASEMGYAWFDDVYLVQWEDWQTSPAQIPFPGNLNFVEIRTATEENQVIIHYYREWK